MTMTPIGVLIVDDECPIREELRAFPWAACDAVLIGEAENGEEALALCERHAPDIVVTDIAMPIMDGLTFIRELRKKHPATQIILLTCHGDFAYAKEAIALGASDYILKVSLDEDELMQALRKARDALQRDRGYRNREIVLRRLKAAGRLETRLKAHRAAAGKGRPPAQSDLSADDWRLLGFADDPLTLRFVLLRLTAPEDELRLAQEAVQDGLLEFERRTPSCKAWFPMRGGEYAVWFSEAAEPEAVRPRLERLLDALLAEAENKGTQPIERQGVALSATVGDLAGSRTDVWTILEAASGWQEADFYDAAPSPRIRIGAPGPLSELEPAHRRHLAGLLGQAGMNADRLLQAMQGEVAPWCAERRFRPPALKRWLADWTSEWLSRSRPGCPDPHAELVGASDWGGARSQVGRHRAGRAQGGAAQGDRRGAALDRSASAGAAVAADRRPANRPRGRILRQAVQGGDRRVGAPARPAASDGKGAEAAAGDGHESLRGRGRGRHSELPLLYVLVPQLGGGGA
ncbi:response regulator [Cohnella rhizosphaerae]|uniref:Response regulator n=1 Tax=Cohnella rhizosphaerae TaxID=1457232 RepID=A0A9X4QV40_9BACL|nr:response regulator [Cohnella rhizosphaerae]MDG0812365.1 response regulator [Cohnella rhizosphaerae]